MDRREVAQVLNKPLALQLMSSDIPARMACTGLDGGPRVVPLGFLWSGAEILICTLPGSYKVRALAADPKVALTIDTTGRQPPHVLLERGTADTEVVEGVPAEYLEAARKYVTGQQWPAFEAEVRSLYQQMVGITVTPEWAKLLDFETTIPTAVERLVRERAGKQES
ncbi:pyridoxamine 5'-phosphate oxidase family protein [Streptomyces sp. NBC_01794]|uniref:pyridoxamine 5'-phosphate oxidase family protein n=1 Tax=Streptomyces sp. NBC_01794 TaxID=2975942 RepID=UPI0030886BB5|nr:pyridoxamine 5'-phosphate oxidase family protein [Streptomyces sp. NBC_01794]